MSLKLPAQVRYPGAANPSFGGVQVVIQCIRTLSNQMPLLIKCMCIAPQLHQMMSPHSVLGYAMPLIHSDSEGEEEVKDGNTRNHFTDLSPFHAQAVTHLVCVPVLVVQCGHANVRGILQGMATLTNTSAENWHIHFHHWLYVRKIAMNWSTASAIIEEPLSVTTSRLAARFLAYRIPGGIDFYDELRSTSWSCSAQGVVDCPAGSQTNVILGFQIFTDGCMSMMQAGRPFSRRCGA